MTRLFRSGVSRVLALTGLLAVVGVGFFVFSHFRYKQYQVIHSPDARFTLIVYRRALWPSAMPGQGSDAPGVARLYDRSGRLLNEASLPMVQQTNDLEWKRDRVWIPLVFDWKLPQE